MNQFKDVFLGKEHRPYTPATTSQKCVRAGGKHNDLENVGYCTPPHVFEMLGNFSFGDYFKREAIRFCLGVLTEELKRPKTSCGSPCTRTIKKPKIFGSTRWVLIKPASPAWVRKTTSGRWEILALWPLHGNFYDHGESRRGLPGSPNDDGDRYIEVWNLVFMQYNRTSDGVLHPLPKPSVDTGMGLERISAVMQHVHSNYEIDLFKRF